MTSYMYKQRCLIVQRTCDQKQRIRRMWDALKFEDHLWVFQRSNNLCVSSLWRETVKIMGSQCYSCNPLFYLLLGIYYASPSPPHKAIMSLPHAFISIRPTFFPKGSCSVTTVAAFILISALYREKESVHIYFGLKKVLDFVRKTV